MTSNNKNDGVRELSIGELFKEPNTAYMIPMYQRNYAWREAEIEQLIEDIESYVNGDQKKYYIGTLVVYQRDDGIFEVIDGQQRLTTLTLILLAFNCLDKKVFENTGLDIQSWRQSAKLTFECRPKSIATLEMIQKGGDLTALDAEDYNQGIITGYHIIKKTFQRKLQSREAREAFLQYLLNSVHIARIEVPQGTDLNHYFEVMNNRGEQLEKHEIIKANLLSKLSEEDRPILSQVWDGVANMERYLQYAFEPEPRSAIFGNEWQSLQVTDYDGLKSILKADTTKTEVSHHLVATEAPTIKTLIANITTKDHREKNSNDAGDTPERFQVVLSFSSFLLHVLRIFVQTKLYPKQFDRSDLALVDNDLPDVALDDKQLIQQFNEYLLEKDLFSGETAESKALENEIISERIKQFTYLLLQCKYLFDHYVIKRDTSKEDLWGIRALKKYSPSANYVNTFTGGETETTDVKRMILLQTAFHYSIPSPHYKHWLSGLLYFLVNEQSDREMLQEIKAQAYLDYMERLARRYTFWRYLAKDEDRTAKGGYGNMLFNNENVATSMTEKDIPLDKLSYFGIENHFVFYYLDYLIWQEAQDDRELIRDYTMVAGGSIEHFYPQNPKNEKRLDQQSTDENGKERGTENNNEEPAIRTVDRFGNLFLISRNQNSKIGNDLPGAKIDHYHKRDIDNQKIVSLKLYRMIKLINSEQKDPNNREQYIELMGKHEDDMCDLLKSSMSAFNKAIN
ncbi:hypothetical protein GCM10007161_03750 [Ignatzschineria indica]|uniref:DUF262 domain-containing protein n=1 Tax=Ignatzschineria indica TaxID=472583 RepID=A0A2U2AMK8_9GAMM|nr:DUF262 domain-containing protein [Ignatzschineria indica]PWD84376.1 hypothetical protein DC082_02205 [Ignatzschineria indica]GGZ75982.1 hypothetical protein GCM10007161_03750 [Ignatzschineria indica]